VLPITADAVRLTLHVLAATVWVGGQLTVVALLPTLRTLGTDAPKVVARRFSRVAWPAFAVLVATGIWNLVAVEIGDASSRYQTTVVVKLVVVAISGLAAAHHQAARSRAALAVGGAVSGVSALVALGLGVLLRS
jgi:putative copper export protein